MGQSKAQKHPGKNEGKGPQLRTPSHLLQLSRASNKYHNNLRSQAALFSKTGTAEQWGTIEFWVCGSGVLKCQGEHFTWCSSSITRNQRWTEYATRIDPKGMKIKLRTKMNVSNYRKLFNKAQVHTYL